MILNKDKILKVLNSFNNFDPNIKFTFELEKNEQLNFLDILVIKNKNQSISADIYKNPTFSRRYVNFASNHSHSTKIGIIKNTLHKIVNLSSPKFHEKNLKIFKKDLVLNGYPTKFINNQFKNFFNKFNNPSNTYENNNNNINTVSEPETYNYKDTIVLPLIPKISKKITYTLKKKCNIKTVFRTPFILNRIIKTGKDSLKKCNNKNLVYKINCKHCPKTYVGQTKRLLKTRSNEHEKNINLASKYHNVISKHVL